ncbi:MAG: efflux RND transporter periplasmic adaptor subunit [Flammeovirgaceae bacterium]|nr:efflux RND transporter periplasmic adaptor subunit [Flammeovirgaceae bacterium]MDW8287293.1 efflux RND transporter periplasmic adaptor subunit [Flammeovirgaceae bacterium]
MTKFSTAVILLTLVICSCSDEKIKEPEKITLPVFTIISQNTSVQEFYVADIQAIRNVEIRNRVSGFIDHISIDEGKKVKKGQVLFKINDEEYKTELASAMAKLKTALAEAKTAELEVERIKTLVDKQVVSSVELEIAKAKLAAAQATVEEAKAEQQKASLKISYTTIIAPFDGVVDRIPFKIGSLLQEGTLLTTVSDVSDVYAYFKISESQYLQYMKRIQNDSNYYKNATIKLYLADGSLYEYDGKLETIEGDFEPTTGSIAMRARFPNPHRLLKHGSSGKIAISNKIPNALLVPHKSVFEVQDKNYVYVVDSENKLKLRSFVPKKRIEKYYIVETGLQAGETVVYEGIQNVKEGLIIIPKKVSPDSLFISKI